MNPAPDFFAELFNPANYRYDPRSLWHFGAAAFVAACTALVVYRERGSRVSRFFAAFTTLFLTWAAARGLMRLLTDPDLVVFLARRFYVLLFLSLPFLYQFTMILLRTEAQRATPIWINWGIGVFMALLCIGSPTMLGEARPMPWGYEPQFGMWGAVAVLWVAAMMIGASADAVATLRRLRAGSMERRRVAVYCVAMGVIYLAAVDFLPALGLPVYPLAFVPVCLFTLLTAFLTLRYGMVEVSPQLAAQEIAGLVRGALLILDRDGSIQYCNRFAESLLGRTRETLLGAPAARLLGAHFEPERLSQLSRMEGHDAELDLLYQAPGSEAIRDLALSAVAVRDPQQRDVAFVCLLRDVTEQKRLQQERRAEGQRDTLTGLPGRPLFLERLDNAVRRAGESRDYDFAVCFIALDRLKVINEDLGYASGDRVLAEMAQRLRKSARAHDTVARLGGDEFGVLLDGTGPDRLPAIAQRLQQVIRAPMRLADHDVHVSASVGIASSTFAYTSGSEILSAAGTAMSQAKRAGGGACQILTHAERGTQRIKLEAELRHALEARQFQVYYQPVLDLVDRRVAGFEALVRWQHPERGLVLPGAFIELAEQIGLSRQLDLFVMEQACADLARLQQAAGDRRLALSFNMAEGCLRDAQFTERIGASLARHGLDPASLRVEVLERVAMITPLRGTLARLRGLGVGLAVDDFGIGYSSLARLHELPLTVLKVDREFVQAMSKGRNSEKVIVAILALGGSLGLTVIAEGAAQVLEVRRLRELGCRYIQGFYFSQAVPFEKAHEMVRDTARYFAEKFGELDATRPAAGAGAAGATQAAAEPAPPLSKLH